MLFTSLKFGGRNFNRKFRNIYIYIYIYRLILQELLTSGTFKTDAGKQENNKRAIRNFEN